MAHSLLEGQMNKFSSGKLTTSTFLGLLGREETKSAGERLSLPIPPQMKTNFRYAGMQMAKSLPMA
jgi:hypothetical protein